MRAKVKDLDNEYEKGNEKGNSLEKGYNNWRRRKDESKLIWGHKDIRALKRS